MHRLLSITSLAISLFGCQAATTPGSAPAGPELQTTAATNAVIKRNLQGFGCLSPDGSVVVLQHSTNFAPFEVHAFSLKDGARLWKSGAGADALIGCFDQGAALLGAQGATVFDYATGQSDTLAPQSPFSDECNTGMSAVPWSQNGEVGFVYINYFYPGRSGGTPPTPQEEEQWRSQQCCATGVASAKGQSLVVKPLDEDKGAGASCSQHQLVAVPRLKSEALPQFQVPGRELRYPSEAFDVGQGRTLIFSFAAAGCVPEIVLSLRDGQEVRWQTPTEMYFGDCPIP